MNQDDKHEREASEALNPQAVTVPRQRALWRLWRAETIYIVALAAFAVLAIFAHLDPYFHWDLEVSEHFNWKNFAPPGLLPFMLFVSTFGNSWIPYALTAATATVFLLFRRRSEAAGIVFSAGGSGLINTLLKLLIARPRPQHGVIPIYRDMLTQSFPSGHVTFYVCYFGFLFFVAYALLKRGSTLRRLALTLTALPVLLVGLSRVYLGAHWPSDTLGAYLWSGVWLAFSLWMYRRWKLRRTLYPNK
jgi:membrane-associated phospholipid phosphatase